MSVFLVASCATTNTVSKKSGPNDKCHYEKWASRTSGFDYGSNKRH